MSVSSLLKSACCELRDTCAHKASKASRARALAGICEKIVIPNLLFREEDEELFEDNPLECASAACNAPSAACNAPYH